MQRVYAAAVLIAALALAAAPAAALAPGCTDGTLCFDTDMPTAPLPCYPVRAPFLSALSAIVLTTVLVRWRGRAARSR